MDVRTLQHSKKIDKQVKKSGKPSLSEIDEGNSELRYIPGSGLYLIVRYNNKLYYLNFSETL